jgi:hypothetical protein
MQNTIREHEIDAEAAWGMEHTLFECKPVLRSVWPELSQNIRFDLFELHVPDLAHSYRVAAGLKRTEVSRPRRVIRLPSK